MEEIRIPMSLIKDDDKFFSDSYELSRKRRIADYMISKKPEEKEEWEEAFMEAELFFIQDHYCKDCKHTDKDYEWHKKNNTTLEFSNDLIKREYVFTCSSYEIGD